MNLLYPCDNFRLNFFNADDTGMFYGIEYYNDMLLQAGETGNVQSELLMQKDAGIFTFREGWAFPRKISSNGEDCVLPSRWLSKASKF